MCLKDATETIITVKLQIKMMGILNCVLCIELKHAKAALCAFKPNLHLPALAKLRKAINASPTSYKDEHIVL